MSGLFEIDLYNDSNPNRRKPVRLSRKSEPVQVDPTQDLSEVAVIKKAIADMLEYLNGKNNKQYTVNVIPNKPNCFRATVFNKETRKILIDFFVQKTGLSEYIYNPPLDVKAFTTNSYENRNQRSPRAW